MPESPSVITNVARLAFYHLRQARLLVPHLPPPCHSDSCNSHLWTGLLAVHRTALKTDLAASANSECNRVGPYWEPANSTHSTGAVWAALVTRWTLHHIQGFRADLQGLPSSELPLLVYLSESFMHRSSEFAVGPWSERSPSVLDQGPGPDLVQLSAEKHLCPFRVPQGL